MYLFSRAMREKWINGLTIFFWKFRLLLTSTCTYTNICCLSGQFYVHTYIPKTASITTVVFYLLSLVYWLTNLVRRWRLYWRIVLHVFSINRGRKIQLAMALLNECGKCRRCLIIADVHHQHVTKISEIRTKQRVCVPVCSISNDLPNQ